MFVDKDKFKKYIIDFVSDSINSGWGTDDPFWPQVKSLFTTYCILFDIQADTAESDNFAWEITQIVDEDPYVIESVLYEFIV